MEEMKFTESEFYQKHFNGRAYLEATCSTPTVSELTVFILGRLNETFSSGEHRGKRLIDIGTGPSIRSLISASDHFEEILASDFTDVNRQELERWLRNEEGCFNWNPVIEYVCSLENNHRTPAQVEQQLRQRVGQVVRCDVRLDNPFHPMVVEAADCITTSLCLESACKDLETYQRAVSNVTSLLRPGGLLVMVGVLEETFYNVGGLPFSCLYLRKKDIEEILRELGFSIKEFHVVDVEYDPHHSTSDQKAHFHLEAIKQ